MKPNLKRLTYFVVIVALFVLIPTMGITASAHQEEPSPEGNDALETIINNYDKPIGAVMQRLTGSCKTETDNLGDDFLFVIKSDNRYYAMKEMSVAEGYSSIPAVDVTSWINQDGTLTVPSETLGVAFMRYEQPSVHELVSFINGTQNYVSYSTSYESADGDSDHYNDSERTYTAKFDVRSFVNDQYITREPFYWSENGVSGTLYFNGSWEEKISSYNYVTHKYDMIVDLRDDGMGGKEFYFRYLGTDVEYEGDEVEGYYYYSDCRHQFTVWHAEYDEPTCMLKGCNEYWYCEGCNRYAKNANFTEYYGQEMPVINAVGHDWENGKCNNCDRPVPVYSKITNQAQFDALADDTMFILVAEYDGNHYVMDFSEVYSYMTDSDGDGYFDIHDIDEDEDGIPDYLEFDEGGEDGVYDYLEWDMDDDGDVDETDILEFHRMICEQHLTDMLYNNESINVTEISINLDGTISHEQAKKTAEFEMVDVYLLEEYGDELPEDWENGEMPYHTKCIKQFVIPNYFLSAPSMRPIERMYQQRVYDFGDSSSWGVLFYDNREDYYYYDYETEQNVYPLPFHEVCQAGSVAVFDTFDDSFIYNGESPLFAQLRLRDYEGSIGFVTGDAWELDGWEYIDDENGGYYDTHDTQACVYLYASAPYETHVCEFGDWYNNEDGTHKRECTDTACEKFEIGDHAYGEWTMKDENYHTHSCPICGATEDFEHSFYDWIAKDDNDHVHECMECDYESVLSHDYEREVTKEPTETEVGEATYTCSLCSHFYTEELPKKIVQITGDVVGTVLNVPAGSNAYVPEGTVFDVVEQPVEQVPEQVLGEIAVTAEGAAKPLGMYDLSLLLDGAKIQPDGTVEVTLPAPHLAAEYDKIIVVYIAPDGSYEECKTTVNEDGTITFETDHFSKYAVIGVNNKGLSGGAIAGIVIGSVVGAILLAVGGFAIFWFLIKKKNLNELLTILKIKKN